MSNDSFRCMRVEEDENGDFDRRITQRSIEDLPGNDVLIRVHYSSLNYKDAMSATGNKRVTKQYPHTPGIDAAGVVEQSGSDEFSKDDEVIVTGFDLGMNTAGGFADYIRVPPAWVVKLPEKLSLRESMIYGTAGLTAAISLDRLQRNGVMPSMGPVLITGASGGVGSLAVGILAKAGYEAVAATGKSDQHDFLSGLGANEVISRESLDDDSGRPLLKGRWAGVIDTVGGKFLATALKSTRYAGAVTCCGLVASTQLETTVLPFILRGISLLGVESVECPMQSRIELWHKLAVEWRVESLEDLAREHTLEELDDPIDAILAGKGRGRVVVNLSAGS